MIDSPKNPAICGLDRINLRLSPETFEAIDHAERASWQCLPQHGLPKPSKKSSRRTTFRSTAKPSIGNGMPDFYEFFAGGGMARAGLCAGWTCLFANDFDHKKGLAYQANWGTGGELKIGDVRKVRAGELSGYADLIWGSFPCQDLSLAGGGAGLKGERSVLSIRSGTSSRG